MKHVTKSLLNLRNFCIASVITVAFLTISTGCNSDKGKKESTNTTTTTNPGGSNVTDQPETAKVAGNPIPFSTLKLDSASLAILFSEKAVIKIIVQVIDSNATNEGLGLIAYGVNKKDEKITGPVGFTALSNPVTTFSTGPIIMGDQELTIRSIKDILGLTKKGGLIDPAKIHALKFVPARDGSKHLFYTVTQHEKDDTDGAGITNPSPPAFPCTDCDYN